MKTVTVNDELVISIQDICDEIGIRYKTIMKHIIDHKVFVIDKKNSNTLYLNIRQASKLLNILIEKRYNNTIKYKIKNAIEYLTNVKPLIRIVYVYNTLYIDITDLSKALTNDKLFTNHSKDYLYDFIGISIFNNGIVTYEKDDNKYIKYDDAILLVNYLKSIFNMYSNKYDRILVILSELKKFRTPEESLDKKLSTTSVQPPDKKPEQRPETEQLNNKKSAIRYVFLEQSNTIYINAIDIITTLIANNVFTNYSIENLCNILMKCLSDIEIHRIDISINYRILGITCDDTILLVTNFIKETKCKYTQSFNDIFNELCNIKIKVDKELSEITKTSSYNTSKTLNLNNRTDNTTDIDVLSFREYSCGQQIRNNIIKHVENIGKDLHVPPCMIWVIIYGIFFNTYPQLDKQVLDSNYRGNYTIIDYIVNVHMICKLEEMVKSFKDWFVGSINSNNSR